MNLRPAHLVAAVSLLLNVACSGDEATLDEAVTGASISAADGALHWAIPPDLPAGARPGDQGAFEDFAWQSFVALNWPATADGSPDTTVTIGASGDAPTVWEHYKEAGEIFLPGGAAPSPWGRSEPPPAICQNLGGAAAPVVWMTSKVSGVVAQFEEPFGGPIVDQDSAFARYAIHANPAVFDYIVQDTLYNRDVLRRRPDPIDFPGGSGSTDSVGAVVLKSAWRVLGPDDLLERFHVMDAYVYTEALPPDTASCSVQDLGLVGFHIAHKTSTYPQWVWATFEQVDNVEVPAGSGRGPSFADPSCDCPDRENQPPPRPWHPDRPGPPTQIVRETPIDTAVAAVNARWQADLAAVSASSPWQYYQLVGVQRPRNPSDTVGTGAPYPEYLANTVLETYDQGTEGRDSSCLECHFRATIPGDSATGGAKFSDYSYMFMLAEGPRGGG